MFAGKGSRLSVSIIGLTSFVGPSYYSAKDGKTGRPGALSCLPCVAS